MWLWSSSACCLFFCADVIAGHRLSAELCSGYLDNLGTRQIVVGAPDTRVEKENYEIIVHDYSNLRGEYLSCEKNINQPTSDSPD